MYITYKVTEDGANRRLDNFLTNNTNFSRSHIQNLIRQGDVYVNDTLPKPSTKLSCGYIIKVKDNEPQSLQVTPQNIKINVVYEDENVIVVNKEKGMVVHPAPGHSSNTLVNALLYHCKNLSGINGVLRPGIVHRIDKDTSGLLVVTKNDITHKFIAKQLLLHTVVRKYNAIVFGNIKENNVTIDEPIGRNPKNRKKMAVTHCNSKNAVTNINVLQRFKHKGSSYTYIEANLQTGRTHQIRVHMSHIGHPLLGDTVYSNRNQPFNTNGQTLHATKLGFLLPNNSFVNLSSPLPDYFQKILNILAGIIP